MRPALEVADIFRRHGDAFPAAQGGRLLPDQRRVMAAIEACRIRMRIGHFGAGLDEQASASTRVARPAKIFACAVARSDGSDSNCDVTQ
jgi:hypothetical protein